MLTYDFRNRTYWCRHKLSNGQYCMIAFEEFSDTINRYKGSNFNVAFVVADKKKQIRAWFDGTKDNTISLKSTGRCGVEALFWARDRILEFEEMAAAGEIIPCSHGVTIWVSGEDSRRFHMYERALSRYGYSKVPSPWPDDFTWYMRKTIKPTSSI